MSFTQRQIVLDLLYNVLKDPEKYGDKFLNEMIRRSNDGMIAVTLLQNMVPVLNEYPIAYISHCIALDQDHRFRQSSDGTKVGLLSDSSSLETDEFGFIQHQDVHDERTNTELRNRSQSVYTQLTDLEELSLTRKPVMPIVYIDGKFYIDEEPKKSLTSSDDLAIQQFSYDKVDIEPLGLRGELNHFEHSAPQCFNCGGNHVIKDCTLPINKFKVAQNKKNKFKDNVPTGRRLYSELELQEQVSKIAPGVLSDVLREALGIREDDEPPYYRNMRANGYPPGYLGKDGYQIPHGFKMKLEDVINKKAPLLKVYGEGEVELESEDVETQVQNLNNTHDVELVYYPGLNLINTKNLDQKMAQSVDSQYIANNSDSQKQWETFYAQQGYYNYPQHPYPTNDQLYPPGTAEQCTYNNHNATFENNTQIKDANMLNQSRHNVQNSEMIHSNSHIHSTTPAVIDDESDDMDISSDDDN